MNTITLPQIFLNFEVNLASAMSASATSFTIDTGVDDDGTALSGRFYFTIDEGLPTEEHIIATLAGTAGTVVLRGISRVDGTTEKSANKFAHDVGASIKITDYTLIHITRLLRGVDTFSSVDLLGINSISGLATPTSVEVTKVANVQYVNDTAISGAPDSSEGVKGLVDKATTAQTKAGDDIGSTTAPLIAVPSDIAANTQSGTFVYAADAGTNDTYVITLVPAITAYTVGMSIYFKANTINTGAATLNVNGLGAKAILKLNDQVLESGDIEANQIVHVIYDGTSFQMQTPQATLPTTAILSAIPSEAILTEMSTFFGATDITGAQAETLSDGSNADSLHTHSSQYITTLVASDTLQVSLETEERPSTSGSYVVQKSVLVRGYSGTIRTSFKIKKDDINGTVLGKVYINGAAAGTERTATSAVTYDTFDEDITVSANAYNVNTTQISLYLNTEAGYYGWCKDFTVSFTPTDNSMPYTINV